MFQTRYGKRTDASAGPYTARPNIVFEITHVTRMAQMLAGPRQSQRRRQHRLATALLSLVFVSIAATSVGAESQCQPDRAIYEATDDSHYKIEFFRDFVAKTRRIKSGVMKHKTIYDETEYDVLTAWSARFGRPELVVKRTGPDILTQDRRPDAGPVPLLIFDRNLHPHRSKSAPAYLILDGIGSYFVDKAYVTLSGEWIIPPNAYKLVGCRGEP